MLSPPEGAGNDFVTGSSGAWTNHYTSWRFSVGEHISGSPCIGVVSGGVALCVQAVS